MTELSDRAPVLMVRTIDEWNLDEQAAPAAETIRRALGGRAATLVSPSHERQVRTATALQYHLSSGMDPHPPYDQNFGMMDVMDDTKMDRSRDAIQLILSAAATRGIWTPEGERGLVVVTSVYPIRAALQAQEMALGVDDFDLTFDIDLGQVVEIDPELVGFTSPIVLQPMDDLPTSGKKPKKWLDFLRGNPHNK